MLRILGYLATTSVPQHTEITQLITETDTETGVAGGLLHELAATYNSNGGYSNMDETDSDKNLQDNRKGWLTDDQGNPSSMRLMSMLALIVAAGLAFIEASEWGSG